MGKITELTYIIRIAQGKSARPNPRVRIASLDQLREGGIRPSPPIHVAPIYARWCWSPATTGGLRVLLIPARGCSWVQFGGYKQASTTYLLLLRMRNAECGMRYAVCGMRWVQGQSSIRPGENRSIYTGTGTSEDMQRWDNVPEAMMVEVVVIVCDAQ